MKGFIFLGAILTGTVALVCFVSLFMLIGPVVRQLRARREPDSSFPLEHGDDCVLRGTLETAEPLKTVILESPAVYVRARMEERVGRRVRNAGTLIRTAPCVLKCERDVRIDLEGAKIDTETVEVAPRNQSPQVSSFLDEYGQFQWPKTPHQLVEELIPQASRVIVRGRVRSTEPPTIAARYVALQHDSWWGIADVRSLVYALLALVVSAGLTVAGVLYAT